MFHLIFITANANCPNILDLCYSFLSNSQVFSTCIFLIVWTNKLAWLEHGDNVAKITGLMSGLWLCIRKWNKIWALHNYKNCPKSGLVRVYVGCLGWKRVGAKGAWILSEFTDIQNQLHTFSAGVLWAHSYFWWDTDRLSLLLRLHVPIAHNSEAELKNLNFLVQIFSLSPLYNPECVS